MVDYFNTSELGKTTAELETWRYNESVLHLKRDDNLAVDQWIRKINLTVYDPGAGTLGQSVGAGAINLSQLRITFTVKKATVETPNLLYARIYNMAPQTMAKVIEFKKVQLQAGYQRGNFGTIFEGTVAQYVRGKENPVDTYLDIWAGDGDRSYTNAVILQTLPAGTDDYKKLQTALEPLKEFDVTLGDLSQAQQDMTGKSLRAQTYITEARRVIRELMQKYGYNFFIDNGVAEIVRQDKYLPGEAVVLSPKTGLVGMPEVTPQGVQARCLLNSKIRLGGRVKIDSTILSNVPYEPGTSAKLDANGNVIPGDPTGNVRIPIATTFSSSGQTFTSAYTSPIGLYKVLLLDYVGDTRGQPWYCELTCIALGSDQQTEMTTFSMGDAFYRSFAGVGASAGSGTP